MPPERTYRRLPLRDLITEAEKRARAHRRTHRHHLARPASPTCATSAGPCRRKSNYPTLLALQNALQRFVQLSRETDELIDHLEQQCNDIRDHAKRERLNRN